MIKYISSAEYFCEPSDDVVIVNNISGNDVKMYLPSDVIDGKQIRLKRETGCTSRVFIMPHRNGTIEGAVADNAVVWLEGTIETAGNAKINIVVSPDIHPEIPNGNVNIYVPLEVGDTPEIMANKIKSELDMVSYISDYKTGIFSVNIRSDNSLEFIFVYPTIYDGYFDVTISDDTCVGITATRVWETFGVPILLNNNTMQRVVQRIGSAWILCSKVLSMDMQHIVLGNPIAATTNRIVTSTNMKVGTYTIANQPDIPRNLTVTISAAGNADTLGKITIEGLTYDGQPLTEEFTPLSGQTVSGDFMFASIDTITGAGWVINQGNDTVVIGVGNILGFPIGITDASSIVIGMLDGIPQSIVRYAGVYGFASASGIDISAGTYSSSKEASAIIMVPQELA